MPDSKMIVYGQVLFMHYLVEYSMSFKFPRVAQSYLVSLSQGPEFKADINLKALKIKCLIIKW